MPGSTRNPIRIHYKSGYFARWKRCFEIYYTEFHIVLRFLHTNGEIQEDSVALDDLISIDFNNDYFMLVQKNQ